MCCHRGATSDANGLSFGHLGASLNSCPSLTWGELPSHRNHLCSCSLLPPKPCHKMQYKCTQTQRIDRTTYRFKVCPSLNPGFMCSVPQFSILCRLEPLNKMMFLVLVSGCIPWQIPFYTASFPAKEQIYEEEDYYRSCVFPIAQHHWCVILSSYCPLATSAAIACRAARTHVPCLSELPQIS